jgi:hypothetical protein
VLAREILRKHDRRLDAALPAFGHVEPGLASGGEEDVVLETQFVRLGSSVPDERADAIGEPAPVLNGENPLEVDALAGFVRLLYFAVPRRPRVFPKVGGVRKDATRVGRIPFAFVGAGVHVRKGQVLVGVQSAARAVAAGDQIGLGVKLAVVSSDQVPGLGLGKVAMRVRRGGQKEGRRGQGCEGRGWHHGSLGEKSGKKKGRKSVLYVLEGVRSKK